MSAKSKKIPTPIELLAEIHEQPTPKTYPFEDYLPAIDAMQKKGLSYADIAKVLKDRVGFKATRGQVFRALRIWRTDQEVSRGEIEEIEIETDEVEERLRENARDLIEDLEKANDGAPWSDPHAIVVTAVEIFEQEMKAARDADEEAAKADAELAEKKK